MQPVRTHRKISRECFSTPVALEEGLSRVEPVTGPGMAVDDAEPASGLERRP